MFISPLFLLVILSCKSLLSFAITPLSTPTISINHKTDNLKKIESKIKKSGSILKNSKDIKSKSKPKHKYKPKGTNIEDIPSTDLKFEPTSNASDSPIQSQNTKVYDTVNMFLSFGINIANMLVWRKLQKFDINSDDFIRTSRMIFCGYLVVAQTMYFLIQFIIKREDSRELIDISNPMETSIQQLVEGLGLSSGPLGSLLAMASGQTQIKKDSISVKEYDLQQLNKAFRTLLLEIIAATIGHLIKPRSRVLLFVALTGLTWKLQSPIVQLHLLHLPAIKSHQRPFGSFKPPAFEGVGSSEPVVELTQQQSESEPIKTSPVDDIIHDETKSETTNDRKSARELLEKRSATVKKSNK